MKTLRKTAIATLTVAIVATTSATAALAGNGGYGGGGHGGGHGGGYVGDGNYMSKFKKSSCEVRTVTFYVPGKGWVKQQRQFCN